ncbi:MULTISPECIES: hypothetical protein [unclassified Mesotoga]|uniref:hypothetical protein n=1 Tax=unclassified Mesotoga TaxID=1184398 RepID=UPI000DA6C064|nr:MULTISPECIES: hypothetical protein [unclassified Mesotoga]PZC52316.1 hypothetical protein LH53_05735 [Mesotoga sp. TolDC]
MKEKAPDQALIEVMLSDGTVIKARKLKMRDLLNATAKDATLKSMQLVAMAIVEVDGEQRKLSALEDIANWDLDDFTKVSEAVTSFSGVNVDEAAVKNS